MRNKPPIIFLISVGLIAVISVTIKYLDYSNLMTNGILTEGTIIKFSSVGSRRPVCYSPIISYTWKDGKQYSFMDGTEFYNSNDSIEVDEKFYKKGDKIKIYYNPADATDATIEQSFEYTALILGLLFGLSCIFLGIFIYVKTKRNMAKEKLQAEKINK